MASTNISIKQQSSVSINVETLQAIIVETLRAIKQRVLGAEATRPLDACTARDFSLFTLNSSLIRLYRHELRMARAVARVIDAHPALSNIALWLMGIALAFEVFMFA